MSDYRHVFGEETASALGLGQSLAPDVRELAADYHSDPVGAFSRMAELMQPPGGGVPMPFATMVVTERPHPGNHPTTPSKE